MFCSGIRVDDCNESRVCKKCNRISLENIRTLNGKKNEMSQLQESISPNKTLTPENKLFIEQKLYKRSTVYYNQHNIVNVLHIYGAIFKLKA